MLKMWAGLLVDHWVQKNSAKTSQLGLGSSVPVRIYIAYNGALERFKLSSGCLRDPVCSGLP